MKYAPLANIRTLCILLAITIAVNATVSAQQVRQGKPGPPGSWSVIGTTEPNFRADHDGIMVAGPFDNFRRVKFKVTDAPLSLYKLVVTYENGSPDNIEVRENIPQGGESRVIDLKGVGTRRIRRIDFWYDTKGIFKGKAKVTMFAMK